jgi:acyl-CoA synthetase (AMP-forming)/AMP-acid ligase II
MKKEELVLPLLNNYIEHWAGERPGQTAMIQHEDDRRFTYKDFARLVDFFALKLQDMGLKKGDRLATMLVLVPEHMVLMYACFKLGIIVAPLDLRLKEEEVVRDIKKINPGAFFFLGYTPVRDFRKVGEAVRDNCPSIEHLVQFTPDPKPGDIIDGAIAVTEMMSKGRLILLKLKDLFTGKLKKAYGKIDTKTPALIIYTTGTTGEPKPAVLTHENIIVQNRLLHRGIALKEDIIIIVNLPPSHVGCVTEMFMTTIFSGGTAVLLRIFDVKLTLEAVEKHRVNVIGQIPTQFRMLWANEDYDTYDLSSLKFAAYAGSAVDVEFLKKLSAMAPAFGTGLGMTENAGFATFTPPGISVEEMAGQVGRAFPDLFEVTVRRPMNEDGSAGDEMPPGEQGEICYHPPVVFQGYFNNPEETARVVSKEGILYTGDIGYFKDMGSYKALYLSGRKKFVIKQKGYNVFPVEVEEHIMAMDEVDVAEVVGIAHKLFDEGIFAFVKPQKGISLTPEMIMEHCNKIASYKRPQHVVIWPAERAFPITRSTKVDKLALKKEAEAIADELRSSGGWDGG